LHKGACLLVHHILPRNFALTNDMFCQSIAYWAGYVLSRACIQLPADLPEGEPTDKSRGEILMRVYLPALEKPYEIA